MIAYTIPDAPSPWRTYQDEPGYKVFKTGKHGFKYSVSRDGHVIQVSQTIWGARRAIRKDRQKKDEPKFWECPLVLKEES